MPTIVGGIRRIKGGVFLSAKIGRIQKKNAECGKRKTPSVGREKRRVWEEKYREPDVSRT